MAEGKLFTDRELVIMGNAWLCFSEQPKLDYEKLAGLCGFTNVRSASNAWSNIKKKLAQVATNPAGPSAGDADDEASIGTSKGTAMAASRKRGKKASVEQDESPLKKAKGRGGKAQRAPSQEPDEENGANGEDIKVAVKAEQRDSNSEDDEV